MSWCGIGVLGSCPVLEVDSSPIWCKNGWITLGHLGAPWPILGITAVLEEYDLLDRELDFELVLG